MKKDLFVKITVFTLFFGALNLQAQDEPADRFSYSYGVLLGKSMKTQGLSAEDIDLEEMLKALKTVLDNKPVLINPDQAQKEYQNKIVAIKEAKSRAALVKEKAFFEENGKKEGIFETPSGIQYEILKEGAGEKPLASNKVSTHYHGTLLDGTIFDSSVNRGEPITFRVTGVIKGWQEILQMMPVGSKWKVYIPSHLGYGNRPSGKIPANSTLIFEMELLSIVE